MKRYTSLRPATLLVLVLAALAFGLGIIMLSPRTAASATTGTYTVNYYNGDNLLCSETPTVGESYQLMTQTTATGTYGVTVASGQRLYWDDREYADTATYNHSRTITGGLADTAGETINLYAVVGSSTDIYPIGYYDNNDYLLRDVMHFATKEHHTYTAEELGITIPAGYTAQWLHTSSTDSQGTLVDLGANVGVLVTQDMVDNEGGDASSLDSNTFTLVLTPVATYTVNYYKYNSTGNHTLIESDTTAAVGADYTLKTAEELGQTPFSNTGLTWAWSTGNNIAIKYTDGQTIAGGLTKTTGATVSLYGFEEGQYVVNLYDTQGTLLSAFTTTKTARTSYTFPTAAEVGIDVPVGKLFGWGSYATATTRRYKGGQSDVLSYVKSYQVKSYYAILVDGYEVYYHLDNDPAGQYIVDETTSGSDYTVKLASEVGLTVPAGNVFGWLHTTTAVNYSYEYYGGETVVGGAIIAHTDSKGKIHLYPRYVPLTTAVNNAIKTLDTQISVFEKGPYNPTNQANLLYAIYNGTYILGLFDDLNAELAAAGSSTVAESQKDVLAERIETGKKVVEALVMDAVNEVEQATEELKALDPTVDDFSNGIAALVEKINAANTMLDGLKGTILTTDNFWYYCEGYFDDAMNEARDYAWLLKTQLESKDAELQAAIDTNTGNIATLTSELATLSTNLSNLTTKVDAIANDLDLAEAAITALQSSVDTINTSITTLTNGLNEANGKIAQNASDITAVNTLVSGLQTDLSALTQRVSTLETTLAATNVKVGDLETALNNLDTAYKAADQALQAAIDKVAGDLTAAKSELQAAIDGKVSTAELTAAVEKLQKEYAAADALLAADISALKTEDAAIKKSVEDLDAAYKAADQAIWDAINKLQSRVDGLEKDVQDVKDAQADSGSGGFILSLGISGLGILFAIVAICIALGAKRY